MEPFISRQGLRIKDFARFVSRQSERVKQHAKDMADRTGRPYIHLTSPVRKEDRGRAIAQRDKITEGLICILATVEACQSFKISLVIGSGMMESTCRQVVGQRLKGSGRRWSGSRAAALVAYRINLTWDGLWTTRPLRRAG